MERQYAKTKLAPASSAVPAGRKGRLEPHAHPALPADPVERDCRKRDSHRAFRSKGAARTSISAKMPGSKSTTGLDDIRPDLETETGASDFPRITEYSTKNYGRATVFVCAATPFPATSCNFPASTLKSRFTPAVHEGATGVKVNTRASSSTEMVYVSPSA